MTTTTIPAITLAHPTALRRRRSSAAEPADAPGLPVLAVRVKQAQRASGLGRTKLYEAIFRGDLPAYKDGGVTLIMLSDLEAYVRGLPRLVPGKLKGKRAPLNNKDALGR
jgi:excisionase family DNA binding protein